jgi:hypothetical protein
MPTAEERLAALEAEVTALRAQVQEVLTQNQELRARLANATKDRHTSSTLPASGPLGRKRPRSQRRRSGMQPGGQLGHRGRRSTWWRYLTSWSRIGRPCAAPVRRLWTRRRQARATNGGRCRSSHPCGGGCARTGRCTCVARRARTSA